MQKYDYLKPSNADFIDEIFQRYCADPNSVDESWRYFFEGLELGVEEGATNAGHAVVETAAPTPSANPPATTTAANGLDLSAEAKVANLINAYRNRGRLMADIDPLTPPPSMIPDFELANFDLTPADLDRSFTAGKLIGLGGAAKLRDIIARLRDTYCRTIGVEFTHIQNKDMRDWLRERMESTANRDPELDNETRKHIYRRISESESFERFLHTRYVAQKRFSIEGAEAMIPALDCMVEVGAELGAQEFVMGMAHRGRLNVLTNTFGKKAEHMFVEFEGTYNIDIAVSEGDVKYHKGYSSDQVTRKGKKVHLSLGYNPSHLEFINPVVEGMVRAKQQRRTDAERTQVVPVLIHGDAAFAGQGVCYETLNLSQLEGYKTGGTLHIVINNQVGFTAIAAEGRSTPYATDLAKMLDAPIFHVNGDDPEALWWASKLCTEFRQKFKADAFIDLICYRRHGHNEGDEPTFTSPMMYKKIKAHATPRELYAQSLQKQGVLTEPECEAVVTQIMDKLTAAQAIAKRENPDPKGSVFEGPSWKNVRRPKDENELFAPVKTAIDASTLRSLAKAINTMPAGFHLHPKLGRFFEARLNAVDEGKGIDWGNGEALAYASLVAEGHPVRVSGQDAERGTFSHRHSALHDFETGQKILPFNAVAKAPARYEVYNSHLSEMAVLGFEHGYSLSDPNSLVVWEAQFGDFANGAQVIIDQFIASSESKWQRMTGITLLLPHGYEGQGPEHSSARLERFLNLCGRQNMAVCHLTTPAQIFHALRRQVKREFRKPLVIMSPKSMLRHPLAVSELAEFTEGGFQEVIDDPTMAGAAAAKARRVLVCTGKVYYDLVAEREKRGLQSDVAIVRVEQIYPWPEAKLAATLNRYAAAKDLVWAQEEPRNMGAWSFVFNYWAGGYGNLAEHVGGRMIRYCGRAVAAAPAVGSPKVHAAEQEALMNQAFGDLGQTQREAMVGAGVGEGGGPSIKILKQDK